jgi:hypothetical protein
MMVHHPKVMPVHLARKAVVYLRQSSPAQARENLQSQRLQYALRDKAITLGFRDVEMIDDQQHFKIPIVPLFGSTTVFIPMPDKNWR